MLLHVNMSVNKCFFIMWSVARGLIEGWIAEMSQSEYEVYEGCFLLRGRIITISRGFAVWHVLCRIIWLLTFNKTQKIVSKSVKHGLKIENKIVRQSLVFVSVAITALFFSYFDNVQEGNIY